MAGLDDQMYDALEDLFHGLWCNEHRGACQRMQREATDVAVRVIREQINNALDKTHKHGEYNTREAIKKVIE